MDFEGDIFRRFYCGERGESIGGNAMTAQYVSTVLQRHASWETFNRYVEEAGTFQDNPTEDIGL